jgi:hypothetical protein
MSAWMVLLAYAAAFGLAVLLDYLFPRVAWHWRVLAVLVALALGMTPPGAQLEGPEFDLVVGSAITLLLVWGISEVFFRLFHLPHAEHATMHLRLHRRHA